MAFLKDIVTARNGIDYSLTKIIGASGAITMMVKFWKVDTPDYWAFGIGIAAIMAALAGKYFVEKPVDSNVPQDKTEGG